MPPLSHRARTVLGSALETALSRAGSAVDRGALRVMRRAWQRGGRLPHDARARMVALAEHYAAAVDQLFEPPDPRATRDVVARERPGRAGARQVVELQYPSRYRPTLPSYRDEWARFGTNLTARARLYRGPGPAGSRPVVICLHGWGGGHAWLEERAFIVRYLIRIGLDPVLFQLPFHAERAPILLDGASPSARRPLFGVARAQQVRRSGALFPSSNVVHTNEAFGQAIWDLRVLAAYLRERGAPAVGAIGMSLGAYTAALWTGLDELSFAGAFIPAVSISRLIWTHGAGSPARREAERAGISADLLDRVFHVHAPLSRPPRVPRERLFVAGARGDLITPPEHAEALWRHWGEPELCWFGGGHVAQLARGDAFRALRRWLYSLPAPHGPCAEAGAAISSAASR